MKGSLYKVYFWGTEKLLNGKEHRTLRTVYMPYFDEVTRKHITESERIERGTRALIEAGYYDIEYGSTVQTELIFTI